ncbi:MAG: peptidylprolyl isomerase [Deltaproteobacteria bacterium]|nr:peptidylprolyl isomerase [Deltaproteobacteria bacterium]
MTLKNLPPELPSVAGPMHAVLHTTQGQIKVKLFADEAPVTVGNFVGLAEGTIPWVDPISNQEKRGVPFYDGIKFHRVIPDFMIQCGDPKTRADRSDWGTGGPGYRFDDEFAPGLNHSRPGMLSMANAGPGTNGSQFFVTEVPTPFLDNKHAVFGEIVAGLEIVKQIARVPRNSRDCPNTPVVLERVEIVRG